MSLIEHAVIIATIALLAATIRKIATLLGATTSVSLVAVGLCLLVLAVVNWRLRRKSDMTRANVEDERMGVQARHPGCHVTLLRSGQWFLTDRSTGREHRPDQQ
ncbi:hypothetical protein [Paraburkholderia sp. BCC1876]|uniref:hypothetical protein n=1 Tax=Paraburkholderia sp. BCC1876 TaxID=2676303 RepID=UPI0015901418|nr:hypothetical protein [Paraburkholderia sp. BCC1876]